MRRERQYEYRNTASPSSSSLIMATPHTTTLMARIMKGLMSSINFQKVRLEPLTVTMYLIRLERKRGLASPLTHRWNQRLDQIRRGKGND